MRNTDFELKFIGININNDVFLAPINFIPANAVIIPAPWWFHANDCYSPANLRWSYAEWSYCVSFELLNCLLVFFAWCSLTESWLSQLLFANSQCKNLFQRDQGAKRTFSIKQGSPYQNKKVYAILQDRPCEVLFHCFLKNGRFDLSFESLLSFSDQVEWKLTQRYKDFFHLSQGEVCWVLEST